MFIEKSPHQLKLEIIDLRPGLWACIVAPDFITPLTQRSVLLDRQQLLERPKHVDIFVCLKKHSQCSAKRRKAQKNPDKKDENACPRSRPQIDRGGDLQQLRSSAKSGVDRES